MILNKLVLKNFKKYKEFSIDFTQGLVGIIGKNGSGKSTLFDGILFALYGELKQKGSKELVKNVYASNKDSVQIILNFEFESKEYEIIREFRGKNLLASAKFFENKTLISSGSKEVTKSIINLTKMNKESFINTLFASQKELTSLSSLDNEHRKKMIRKLLGLEKIDLIENFLKESISILNKEIKNFSSFLLNLEVIDEKNQIINEHKSALEILQEKIKKRENEFDEIRKNEEELYKNVETLNKIKEQKQSLSYKFEYEKAKQIDLEKQKDKFEVEKKEILSKKSEYKNLKDVKEKYISLQSKIATQEKIKENYLKKMGLIKQRDELRHAYQKQKNEIKYLEEQSLLFNDIQKKEKELNEFIILSQKQLQDKKISERELRDKIAGEEKLIIDTKNKIKTIKELGKDSKCPTCTRKLLDDYDMVLDNLYKQIEQNYEVNINTYKNDLSKLEERIEAKQKEYDDAKNSERDVHSKLNLLKERKKELANSKIYLDDIEKRGKLNNEQIAKLEGFVYDDEEYKKLLEKYEKVKKDYEYVIALETQLQRQSLVEKSIENKIEEIKVIKEKINELQKELEIINYDEKNHEILKTNLLKLRKSKDDLLQLIHTKKLEESKIKGEINSLNKELEDNELQKQKLQNKIDDLNDYSKLKLTMQEFKTNINSKIAPKISQIASNMYSKITKGKYQFIEVSNDFDFFIYDDGKKYPIERFSGGEVDLANLVLRIAISKTLGELNGSSQMGFLAFDEVFGSQDENRRLEILEAFHTIKEQYRQIFLISHEMEIKEMFEKVIEL